MALRGLLSRAATPCWFAEHQAVRSLCVAVPNFVDGRGGLGVMSWAALAPSLLEWLWLAVPKSKVSPSRKRMRGFHRAPKNVTHYGPCPKCGSPTLRHHLCDCMLGKGQNKQDQPTFLEPVS